MMLLDNVFAKLLPVTDAGTPAVECVGIFMNSPTYISVFVLFGVTGVAANLYFREYVPMGIDSL